MEENNKLVLLICTLILLITSGWYAFVVIIGPEAFDNQQQSPTELARISGSKLEDTSTPSPRVTATPEPTLQALPQTATLTGGAHMFQTFNNCGPASLAMTLSYFGETVSQQTLGQQLRPYQNPQGDNDDKSVTLQEIAAKGEEYGLVAYHRPAGSIEVLQKFIAYDIPVITRTWLEPGEDIGHYRVVRGYDMTTEELIQDDSLQGRNLRYSYSAFNELWQAFNYEFVVLVPTEKVEIAEVILAEDGILHPESAWQKALEISNAELANNPNAVGAKFNRSVALFHLGRYQEATSAFEDVEQDLPSRMLWYQIEPIKAYYESGNAQRVLSLTANILDNHNRAFSELYYLRAQVYQGQGNAALAEEEMRKAEIYNSTDYWRVNVE